MFLFFFGFYFSKISFSLQKKKRIFEKQTQEEQPQKNTIFKVKMWSNYVAQHNWTAFLTLARTLLNFFFVFFCGWNPNFIVFSAKYAKLKETQKRKKDTICEHNCANNSCQNVRFFFIFHFCCFSNFHFFRDVFDRFPKIKNNKIAKQEEQKNNNNQKTRCKAKINEMLWFKTTQDNKQNNKNKRTSWNKKGKHNKKKKQEPEREIEKQEGRKKRTRERREREIKKEKGKFRGEAPKRLKRNKGRHWQINKKCPF